MNFKKQIRVIVLISIAALTLTSCGQEKSAPKTISYNPIECIEHLSFDIPSDLRKGAITYNEYTETKASILDNFETGRVETQSLDWYRLTDFQTFYIEALSGVNFLKSLDYYSSGTDFAAYIESSMTTLSNVTCSSDIKITPEEDKIKEYAAISFQVQFPDDTGSQKTTDTLSGYICGIEHHGSQYVFLVGCNDENTISKSMLSHMVNSVQYTDKGSSIFSSSRTPISIPGSDCSLSMQTSNLIANINGELKIPAYDCTLTVSVENTETPFSTQDLITASMPVQDVAVSVAPVFSKTISGEEGGEWIVRTYSISGTEKSFRTVAVTSKGRTFACIYIDYSNEGAKPYIEELIEDTAAHSIVAQYMDEGGNIIDNRTTEEQPIEDQTAEETTGAEIDVSTEDPATEAPTEEPVTEEVTEAPTTELTSTEGVTEGATEQPTTEQATTTQATTRQSSTKTYKKPSKKKKNNDLDVKW